MPKAVLNAPHFHNEDSAIAYVEARVSPKGHVCPHCGGMERISKMGEEHSARHLQVLRVP